ncbi:ABC transporter substrate-binding protein [Salinirubellus sp. GCM10025818]
MLNDRSGRDIWESAAEEFNSQSDYSLDITWLPKGTAANEQIQKMKAAGNMPAIAFETSTDAYRETSNGNTAPLTDVVDELGVKDTVRYEGESYMVPVVAIPLTMIYRTDIVQDEPRTRQEWQAEAERIQSEENMAGYVVPSGRTNAATTHANQTLWNGGVDPYDGTAGSIEVVLDQGETRELAVQSYEWLQTMDELGPQASGWAWGDVMGSLIQEQLAAWAGIGGLALLEIIANRPDMAENVTAAPYPAAEGQEQFNWWSYFEGMYCYESAENLEGAREFIRFFVQSDYYYEFLRQTAGSNFPTSEEGLTDDRFASAEILQNHPDFLDVVAENWDSMRPVLQTGDDGSPNLVAANAYGQQLYGQSVDQMLYGGKSPGEAVDWLANELRNLGN